MSLTMLQSDYQCVLEQLNSFSNDQLNDLLNNDEGIEHLLATVDNSHLKCIEAEKEEIQEANKRLVDLNLTREPELVDARKQVHDLGQMAEQLSKSIEEKMKQIRDKGGDTSLETALALLQTVASEAEEDSDQFAKQFLANEVDLEQFIDEFLVKRKLVHLRQVKAEKLIAILTNQAAPPSNAPPLSLNHGYFPGIPPSPQTPPTVPLRPTRTPPYPMGSISMPMPLPPNANYFQNHY